MSAMFKVSLLLIDLHVVHNYHSCKKDEIRDYNRLQTLT